jgi:hypothetical protein
VATSEENHWVLIRRHPDHPTQLAYFYCYAPADATPEYPQLPVRVLAGHDLERVEQQVETPSGDQPAGRNEHLGIQRRARPMTCGSAMSGPSPSPYGSASSCSMRRRRSATNSSAELTVSCAVTVPNSAAANSSASSFRSIVVRTYGTVPD